MNKIDLSRHVREVGEWSCRNFPGKTAFQPAMGFVEEVGELFHAFLKRQQGIRGTKEEHDAAERDAIADSAIYLCDLASMLKIEELACYYRMPDSTTWTIEKQMAVLVTDASNIFSAVADLPGYRSNHIQEYIECAVATLGRYSEMRGWDFMDMLDSTWSEVSKRDWIKYPGSGLPPAEAEAEVVGA
jgi:NTP pyrophosphatase (non-canonical NTP hydrolase)